LKTLLETGRGQFFEEAPLGKGTKPRPSKATGASERKNRTLSRWFQEGCLYSTATGDAIGTTKSSSAAAGERSNVKAGHRRDAKQLHLSVPLRSLGWNLAESVATQRPTAVSSQFDLEVYTFSPCLLLLVYLFFSFSFRCYEICESVVTQSLTTTTEQLLLTKRFIS
jgi:hypothetical protein